MAEDRKFKFEDGKFINRVSGEAIPDDEPVIIFRARDAHAVRTLQFYAELCSNPRQIEAVNDRIEEFVTYRQNNPGKAKEPGMTGEFVLNREVKDHIGMITDIEKTVVPVKDYLNHNENDGPVPDHELTGGINFQDDLASTHPTDQPLSDFAPEQLEKVDDIQS